jgi:hypothetical protein
MPVPVTINDLSTVAATNFPLGSDFPHGIDDTLRAHAQFVAELRDSRALQQTEYVHVDNFGAVGGGVVNDTAAFAAAAASFGVLGGTIHFSKIHLIDSNLTLPDNVVICGPTLRVGSTGTSTTAPFANMAGLVVNSAVTIKIGAGAGLIGCLLRRKGMTFPAADSSAFAGTAVTVDGHDAFVDGCIILGFERAVLSNGFQRFRAENTLVDCLNGFRIENSLDIPHITGCHCWPFATIFSFGPASSLHRSGIAYHLLNTVDWGMLTNNFSYGYLVGFKNENCNSVTYLACGADGTAAYANSTGFLDYGSSQEVAFVGCRAAGQDAGIVVNIDIGARAFVNGCEAWGNTAGPSTINIAVNSGDLFVVGGMTRGGFHGVLVNNATSRVFVDDVCFNDHSLAPIYANVATTTVFIGDNDYGNYSAGNAPFQSSISTSLPSVTAADPLNLPANGKSYTVTGNTNFGTINGGYAGRRITLDFAGTPTLFHGGGAPGGMKMKSGSNFAASSTTSISFLHNGSVWKED